MLIIIFQVVDAVEGFEVVRAELLNFIKHLLIIKIVAPEKAIVVFLVVKLWRYVLHFKDSRRLVSVGLKWLAETVLLLLEDTIRDARGGNLIIVHRKIFVVQVFLDLFA